MSRSQKSLQPEAATLRKCLRLEVANRGFALVATLMLMILLLLLAIGLLSLSAVSLRTTGTDDTAMEARANARLGLMLAIGKLQESMGPDRRISARSLTLSKDARIGTTLTPDNPRSWWVGAAGTNPAFGLDGAGAVTTRNPAAVWLVSGLDPNTTAASQLVQPFGKPVSNNTRMLSLGDLALVGGDPAHAASRRLGYTTGTTTIKMTSSSVN